MARRERILLALILLAGSGLRIAAVTRSAVEHFDEGVYASNLWFGPPDYAYPMRQLYAPPLLPALIEAGMIAGLPPNLAALLPSLTAGCGTIVALWWFGRTWFSPAVGLAAATLCAFSGFHITYSAAALTDVLLGLWLVLAVQAIGLSLWRGDLRWAVAGGVFTGLAWWTKYNGWLPLAIESAALAVLWFLLRPPRRQLLTWLACLGVTTLVAAAVWSPYYISLQAHGGYGPIAANHGRYVVGLSGWLDSAARQISSQYVADSGVSVLGLVLALFLPSLLEPRRIGEAVGLLVSAVGGTCAALMLTGLFAVGVGAAAGIARFLVAFHQAPRLDAQWRQRMVGLALVFAWWGGMLVATPFYTAYPRLALPLLVAIWLSAALNWDDVLRSDDQEAPPQAGSVWAGLLLVVLVVGSLSLMALLPHEDHLASTNDRRGLADIAQQIRRTDVTRQPRAIYVFGEPATLFQLRAAGEEFVVPVQEVPTVPATAGGQPITTLLIVGPHAQRDPVFRRQMAAAQDRWTLQREYDYQPSSVVWLDLNDPRSSPKPTATLDRVRVYRLRQ